MNAYPVLSILYFVGSPEAVEICPLLTDGLYVVEPGLISRDRNADRLNGSE
jgi:hypothetical protein